MTERFCVICSAPGEMNFPLCGNCTSGGPLPIAERLRKRAEVMKGYVFLLRTMADLPEEETGEDPSSRVTRMIEALRKGDPAFHHEKS